MLCQFCKKAAAKVHYTQIVANEVKKVDLCEACAKEKGADDPTVYSIADVLLGLGASQKMEEATASTGNTVTCPGCGFTQADFKKTGRLGCSRCYEVFADGLEQLLKGMHRGIQHKGKFPPAVQRTVDSQNLLQRLESELQSAVAKEDFELAATIRDQIKEARKATAGPETSTP
ncbi:MAG: excinuclease ABC subunit B [Verrucomicrobia bacterium]|nr:excinuclease ABC subunit B [Verrucomicrobiota bacterium]